MIEIVVRGHPETGHRPRVTSTHAYLEPDYQAWRDQVAWMAKGQVDGMMSGHIILAIHFFSKTWQSQDLDNLAKAVLDGLQGVVYQSDRQIVNLHLFKSRPEDEECIIVRAWTPIEFGCDYQTAIAQLFDLTYETE